MRQAGPAKPHGAVSATPLAALTGVTALNFGVAQTLYAWVLFVLPDASADLGGANRDTVLATALASGAAVALAAAVVLGSMTDRWVARGRSRTRLLLPGALLGAVALTAASFADSTALLVLAWCVVQLSLNSSLCVATCGILDWFAPHQRAAAGAAAAAGQVAGALTATVSVAASGNRAVLGPLSAVVLVVSGLVAVRAARSMQQSDAPTSRTGDAVTGPYRDAALAWVVRATMTFSNVLVVSFIGYFVDDELDVAQPRQFLALAGGAVAVSVLVGAVAAGRSSDRTGRRRAHVIGAAAVMAAGELGLALSGGSAAVVLAACCLTGSGYGAFLAVDQAMTLETLPRPRTYGRDIGLMNTSSAAPQVAAPLLAGLLLGLGSGYAALFALASLASLASAAAVPFIRKVR